MKLERYVGTESEEYLKEKMTLKSIIGHATEHNAKRRKSVRKRETRNVKKEKARVEVKREGERERKWNQRCVTPLGRVK